MEEQFGTRCWKLGRRSRVPPTRSIDLIVPRQGLAGNHHLFSVALLHTSEIPSTNRKSKASSRMHRGSCITRRKASARKARKPNSTSHCQRPHKHAEQLLLSRIQSHAEGDESAKRRSSIYLMHYSAADVNLRQGKRGGYFHNESLPNGNRALFSEAAATLVPEAMSVQN